MKLMAEVGNKRTYLGKDNETWYEVMAEIRGQWGTIGEDAYAIEAVRKKTEYLVLEKLDEWVEEKQRTLGIELIGTAAVSWERVPVYLWVEDPSHPAGGYSDYNTIIGHNWRCLVEQGYWPPAPVDPDGEEPPLPTVRDIQRGPNS